ncbi:MAG TPA: hypothetical protein VFB99_22500, partial [Vicinamibacterales bacterium]|nr:hypothetical protein [Vicinamibacterales bacterium]
GRSLAPRLQALVLSAASLVVGALAGHAAGDPCHAARAPRRPGANASTERLAASATTNSSDSWERNVQMRGYARRA